MASQRTLTLIAIVFLAIVTCAVYSRALNSPFVFDDNGSVTDNLSIVRLWPLVGDAEHPGPLNPPMDLPTSGRPLVNLSLAINYYFGELNPRGYHVFNLIVHVLSAWLVMAIVRRTLRLDYFEGRFQDASGPLALIVALVVGGASVADRDGRLRHAAHGTDGRFLLSGDAVRQSALLGGRFTGGSQHVAGAGDLGLSGRHGLQGSDGHRAGGRAVVERTFIAGSFRRALQKSWPLVCRSVRRLGAAVVSQSQCARVPRRPVFIWNVPPYAWWLTQTKVLFMYLKLTVWPWPLAIHYEMPYLTTIGDAWPWMLFAVLLMLGTLMLSVAAQSPSALSALGCC